MSKKIKATTEAVQNAPTIALTDEMIADFTRLAACIESHDESGKECKEIKDKHNQFIRDNEAALRSKHGVRVGNLRIWVEIKRMLNAEIVD